MTLAVLRWAAAVLAITLLVPALYLVADLIARAVWRRTEPQPHWDTWPADVTAMARMEEELLERKEPARKADEYDVITRWRRYLIWRPGEVAGIKRRLRRRGRHRIKRTIRRGDDQ